MVPPILRELTRLDSVGQVDLIAPLSRWLTPTLDDPDLAPKRPLLTLQRGSAFRPSPPTKHYPPYSSSFSQ